MRVAQVNYHEYSGGAARAAGRLHMGLRAVGVDSEMVVMEPSHDIAHVKTFVAAREFRHRLARFTARKRIGRVPQLFMPPGGFELFSTDRSELGGELAGQLAGYDLVNLHWIRGMFDYRSFMAGVAGRTSLVWTLHDMNPFTGGCHYDDNCGRFTAACGACPQLKSATEHDQSRQIWRRKQQAFAKLDDSQLTIVTPSRWMAHECQRSSLLGRFRIETIPYGLDLEQYRPRDPNIIRQLLDIPEAAFVVLALADGFRARRKGFAFVKQLIEHFAAAENVYFLLVGAGDNESPHQQVRHLAHNRDERFLSFVYSAADVFVTPALQDNLPNTVMESIACGTPVVAFDVGGIGDMVRPGESGVLAPSGDVAALASAIGGLRENPALRERLSQSSRALAEREFSMELQANRYRDLYAEILQEAPADP